MLIVISVCLSAIFLGKKVNKITQQTFAALLRQCFNSLPSVLPDEKFSMTQKNVKRFTNSTPWIGRNDEDVQVSEPLGKHFNIDAPVRRKYSQKSAKFQVDVEKNIRVRYLLLDE